MRERGPLLLAAVALFAGLLFMGAVAVRMWPASIDDSWISFTYARNLAEGHGLVFYPGQRVEGYSCPLWVAALAPARLLGLDLLSWSKALSILAWAATAVLLWKLAQAGGGGRGLYGALAVALLAAVPSQAFWTMMGMETPLFMCLLTAAVFLHVRSPDRPAWSALAGALALTRPEGALIFAVLFAVWAVYRLLSRREGFWRDAARLLGAFLAVVVPYEIFRLLYFHDFVPNTYYFKAATRGMGVSGAAYLRGWLHEQGAGASFVLLILGFSSPSSLRRRAMATALAATGALMAFAGHYPDWMPASRFLAPAAPLWALGLVLGLRRMDEILEAGGRALPGWCRSYAAPLAAVLIAAGGVARFEKLWRVEGWRALHGYDSRLEFGRWLEKNTPADILIAYGDMGAMPYASRRRFLDYYGLFDREAARIRAALQGPPFRTALAEYVLRYRPDMLIDAFEGPRPPRPEETRTTRMDIGFFLRNGYEQAGFLTAYPPGRYPPFREGRTLIVLLRRDSALWPRRAALAEAMERSSEAIR